jgi:hypothetical protein
MDEGDTGRPARDLVRPSAFFDDFFSFQPPKYAKVHGMA